MLLKQKLCQRKTGQHACQGESAGLAGLGTLRRGRTHEEADEVRVDERVAREVAPGAVRDGALGLERV